MHGFETAAPGYPVQLNEQGTKRKGNGGDYYGHDKEEKQKKNTKLLLPHT